MPYAYAYAPPYAYTLRLLPMPRPMPMPHPMPRPAYWGMHLLEARYAGYLGAARIENLKEMEGVGHLQSKGIVRPHRQLTK